MAGYRPGKLMRAVFRAPSRLYDRKLGWLFGSRLCRLTHQGRKSGRSYRVVLEVIEVDQDTGGVVLVSGFGRTSDWYRNIQDNGVARIEIGRRCFTASVRELETAEAMEVFQRYEQRYRLLKPLVRRLLGTLLGAPYDGSAAARGVLVSRLPLVLLTPNRAHG